MTTKLHKSLVVCCLVASFLTGLFINYPLASPVSIRHTHLNTSRTGVTPGPIIQTFETTQAIKDRENWNSTINITAMESLFWKPKTDDVNLKLIFIRIPKTGSRTLGQLVLHQLERKGFRYINVEPSQEEGNKRRFLTSKEGKVVFAGHTRHMELPWSPPPIYISLTRDPVERFMSNFYFSFYGDTGNTPRTVKHTMSNRAAMAASRGGNTTIPTPSECILQEMPFCIGYHRLYSTLLLFCGYDPRCNNLSEWTYSRAVKHVNGALAVGVTEEFGDYLRVLECLAPGLFSNISTDYERPNSKAAHRTNLTKTRKKKPLTSEADEKLRELMKMEYRIYNYIKDRFHQIKKELLI